MTPITVRRLAALTLVAAIAVPAVAEATTVPVTNPTNGCTYNVYGPTYTVWGGPPGLIHITQTGGFGESTSCP